MLWRASSPQCRSRLRSLILRSRSLSAFDFRTCRRFCFGFAFEARARQVGAMWVSVCVSLSLCLCECRCSVSFIKTERGRISCLSCVRTSKRDGLKIQQQQQQQRQENSSKVINKFWKIKKKTTNCKRKQKTHKYCKIIKYAQKQKKSLCKVYKVRGNSVKSERKAQLRVKGYWQTCESCRHLRPPSQQFWWMKSYCEQWRMQSKVYTYMYIYISRRDALLIARLQVRTAWTVPTVQPTVHCNPREDCESVQAEGKAPLNSSARAIAIQVINKWNTL